MLTAAWHRLIGTREKWNETLYSLPLYEAWKLEENLIQTSVLNTLWMKPSNWKPGNNTITTVHETNYTNCNHIYKVIINAHCVAKLIAVTHKSLHSLLSPNTQEQNFKGHRDHVDKNIFISIQHIYWHILCNLMKKSHSYLKYSRLRGR
jgi:hypothetical protein